MSQLPRESNKDTVTTAAPSDIKGTSVSSEIEGVEELREAIRTLMRNLFAEYKVYRSEPDERIVERWSGFILSYTKKRERLANEQGFYAAMGVCGMEESKVAGYYKTYRDKLAELENNHAVL